MVYDIGFLKEDIETGLLKNIPVGMKRRTIKIDKGLRFEDFVYLPFKKFVVLRVKGRFEK